MTDRPAPDGARPLFGGPVTAAALVLGMFTEAVGYGMVAPTLDGIALRSFASDYGIGARFHGPGRTPLRVELAKGREGARVVFAASAAF